MIESNLLERDIATKIILLQTLFSKGEWQKISQLASKLSINRKTVKIYGTELIDLPS